MKLSVVIPVYNERVLIPQIMERVKSAPLPDGLMMEIVVVDDCSSDDTRAVVAAACPAAGAGPRAILGAESGRHLWCPVLQIHTV